MIYTNTKYADLDAEGGGDGSQGSPWTFAEAVANALADTIVYVKAGSGLTLSGGLTVAHGGDFGENTFLSFCAYHTTPGDMNYGGSHYGEYADIDANNTMDNVITLSGKTNVTFSNIYLHNSDNLMSYLVNTASSCHGTAFYNCKFNDALGAIHIHGNGFLFHNCWFGTTWGEDTIVHDSGYFYTIVNCRIGAADGYDCLGNFLGSIALKGNVFYGGKHAIIFDGNNSTLQFIDNVFYGQSERCVEGKAVATYDASYVFFNNIFAMPAMTYGESVDCKAIYFPDFGHSAPHLDYNCAWCYGTGTALTTPFWDAGNGGRSIKGLHDIELDPKFVDAANGDFSLKISSPCLATGLPTRNGGCDSMGVWEPEYKGRAKESVYKNFGQGSIYGD